jgi:alanine racemase
MDQFVVGLADAPARVGDDVTLIGPGAQSFDDWARILGTNNYEVVCGIRGRFEWTYFGILG